MDLSSRPKKLQFLGIVIDSHLCWEVHISQVEVVQSYSCFILQTQRLLYQRVSETSDSGICLHPCILLLLRQERGYYTTRGPKGQLGKNQKLINFAARIVTGVKKHEPISSSLQPLNWPRIKQLVNRRDSIKVFKGALLMLS